MFHTHPLVTSIILSLGLSLLAGCVTSTSQQTRFYRLNPEPVVTEKVSRPASSPSDQPQVGIGPVHLSSYLDRPQLISRIDAYQLTFSDFDHWAGTLQENITSGLVASLQARIGSDAVIAYPWHGAVRPSNELILDFTRFDAQDGHLVVKVRCTLLADRGDRLLGVRQVELLQPIESTSPKAFVVAASQALDRLAEQLANFISKTTDQPS